MLSDCCGETRMRETRMRTYCTIRVEALKVRPLLFHMEISNQIEGIGELSFIDDEETVRRMMLKIDELFRKPHVVFERKPQ